MGCIDRLSVYSILATAEADAPNEGAKRLENDLNSVGILGEYRAVSKITVRGEADHRVRR